MAETERLLPNRPNPDTSKIPASDKEMIAYMVAFNIPNQKAFALWHPEFLDSSGKLNKTGRAACTQFFNYSKNREYADSYAAYLKAFLSKKEQPKSEASAIIDDARKDNARVALYNKVIRLIEGDDELDPDTLKIAVDMAKKLSIVADDAEEQVIKPIRVLLTKCKAECRYRAFVETQVLEGRVFDDCSYCRARAYAEEHGFKYDPCKLLDVPQDVIDELDSKNDVRMEDILSGRVNN